MNATGSNSATCNLKEIIKPILIAGKEILPIIEGGKGVNVSTGTTAGHFAKNGAIGTFSGVNSDYINDNGQFETVVYTGKTRIEKHEELINYGIKAAVSQAKRAWDIAQGRGRVHMNVLWEMGGASRVLNGVLEKTKGLISGVTCGAGMPYQLAEIAAKYKVHYYPIVSSMRAFRILWKRSYLKFSDWLGGVVYECPWKAGGHNGLSNAENPNIPEDPYHRIVELRKFMNEVGLHQTPIILAGGVWHIKDYEHYLNNEEVGPIAFQFGTRPIYTKESPVSDEWKVKMMSLKEGDVYLNNFSPTGFYSSAVRNSFLTKLISRSERQVSYSDSKTNVFNHEIPLNVRRSIFINHEDLPKINDWTQSGFTEILKTPEDTVIFVNPSEKIEILTDQRECMGCLSMCKFSNFSTHHENFTTGKLPDPRSFCIQKTLQSIGHGGNPNENLMFSGSNVFRLMDDPWYKNGFIPTIKELVDRIKTGY